MPLYLQALRCEDILDIFVICVDLLCFIFLLIFGCQMRKKHLLHLLCLLCETANDFSVELFWVADMTAFELWQTS